MRHGRPMPMPMHEPLVVEVGVRGIPGARGEKGDALKFEDLTDEQKAELKGEKGDPGEDAKASVPISLASINNLF